MADQETLDTTRPDDTGGIWRRHIGAGNVIDHATWLRAHNTGDPIGHCRRCGLHLHAEAPDDHQGRTDYTASCVDTHGCGYSLTAPGGRIMRGSAQWSHSGGAARAKALSRKGDTP